MAPTWVVGATVNLLGSILINLGTNLMKLGHNKSLALEEFQRNNNAPASPTATTLPPPPPSSSPSLEKDSTSKHLRGSHHPSHHYHHHHHRSSSNSNSKPRPARSFREWQAGIALFAGGNVFNFVSFGFAAQSLLAALGSVQFVSNVVFARLVLKEAVTWRVLGATALIVTGCILLVTFGNHGSELLSAKKLMRAYANPAYIAYLVLAFLGIAIAYCLYRHGKAASLDPRRTAAARSRWSRSLPVSYALFSGLLGTQSVLFCKALSTLLRTTLHGQSQLGSWFFWVCLLALVLTALFWVSRLNKGLRLFPAVVIVPTMQISWTLFSIVSGMVYYQEYRSFSTLSACMFALGVAVVFVGVWLLTPAVVSSSNGGGAVGSEEKKEVDEGSNEAAARAAGGNGDTNNAAAAAPPSSAAAAAVAVAVVPVSEDDGISVEPLVTSEDEDEEAGAGRGVRSGDDDDGERMRRRRRRNGASPSSSTAAATVAASSLHGGESSSRVGGAGSPAVAVPPLDLGGFGSAAEAGKGTPRSPFANEHWRQQAAAALSPASSAGASHSSAPAAATGTATGTAAGSSPSRWEDIALGATAADGERGGGSEPGGGGGQGSVASAASGRSGALSAAAAAAAPAAAAPRPRPSSSSSSRVRRRTCNSFMDDLADDFSVDAPSSLRPLLGLGPPGGAMAAVSLFSVPYEGLLPRGGGGSVVGGGGGRGSVASVGASPSLEDPDLSASSNAGGGSSSPLPELSARLSSKHGPRREVQLRGQQQGQQGREQQGNRHQQQKRWSAPGDVESAAAGGAASAAAATTAAAREQQQQQLRRGGGAGVRIAEEGLSEEEEEEEEAAPPSSPPLSARAVTAAASVAAARVARGVAAGAARVASPASDRPRPLSEDGEDGADGEGEHLDLEALPPPAAASSSLELPNVKKR